MIASRRDAIGARVPRRAAVTLPNPTGCAHRGELRKIVLRNGRLFECQTCGRILDPGTGA